MAKDRVSSLEVYGFVGWISSSAVLGEYGGYFRFDAVLAAAPTPLELLL